MNKEGTKRLLLTIKIILIITGITFICLSILTDRNDNTYLILALISTLIANIMNVIDIKRTEKQNSNTDKN